MKIAAVTMGATMGLAVLVTAGCGISGHPTAVRTVTHTVIEYKTRVETAPAAAVKPTSPAVSSPAASSGSNQVITRLNGSGTQNTAAFTTPDSWHLSWSYWACPDGRSNFQVFEYNSDGSLDSSGISVNELGTGRGPVATYAYGDAGTHYLSVNLERTICRSTPKVAVGHWCRSRADQHDEEMTGRDDFLTWVKTALYEAEVALHNGDAGPAMAGDMPYTAGLEHVSLSMDGQPRSFTLRATQVYRREGGEWKVAHRPADGLTH